MGLLDRVRRTLASGRVTTNVTTTTHASFDLTVPAANAEQVRTALQDWIASKGSSAVVAVRTEGDQAHLTFAGDAPNLADPGVATELSRLLEGVLK